MQENTPYSNLKAAIVILEEKQFASRQDLQEQFKETFEQLNPINFLKNSISSFTGFPEIQSKILALLIPLATGILSKKGAGRSSRQSFVAQAGVLFLDGLNRYITQNPEVISTISNFILNLFKKKKAKPVEQPE